MHLWTLNIDLTQSLLATHGTFTNLWELAMRSPTRLQFPQSTPLFANLTNRSTITIMASYPCGLANLWWGPCIYNAIALAGYVLIAKDRLAFSKRFSSSASAPTFIKWVISSFMHGQYYLLNTTLWVFFTSMAPNGTIIFFMKPYILNLPCGTYNQLCLYSSNSFTNLTSLSTLPLQNSSRNLCALG